VDISASGNFGSGTLSKRDLAAELASVLAFSAIRNSDKVGLLLYTDRVERYLPPKKGRSHVLRVVRDVLHHEPEGRGTDGVKALDIINRVLHRRAIVFLISDFESPGDPIAARTALRRAMRQTNRRHDLIAVHIEDPREKELPNVGILALEDAETGEIIELDTTSAAVRKRFKEQSLERSRKARHGFPIGGYRYLAASDRLGLHACPAEILQEPRTHSTMRDGAVRTRSALAGCVCAILLRVSAFAPEAAAGATVPPEDIRDIRGPKLIRPRWILPAILSGAALLTLCAYGIWRWQRSPGRERPLLPTSWPRGGSRRFAR